MQRISGAFGQAYLEYALVSGYELIACSFFDRSNQVVKSVASAVTGGGTVYLIDESKRERRASAGYGKGADSYIAPMRLGKERVSHALCVSRKVNTEGVLTTKERKNMDVYNFLMTNFTLPLLPEWVPEILKAVCSPFQRPLEVVTSCEGDLYFPLGNKKENVKNLIWITLNFKEDYLEKTIKELLESKKICISPNKQNPLRFENMDDYFHVYGSGVMDNLTKLLHPVSEHTDKMEYEALKGLRLYPQQISIDNGVINYFRKKKGRYALFNCGMGTGKTIMGAVAVDGFFNSLAMDKKKRSLKEVLCDKGAVKYRNIVMCPPHLVEKWVKEINTQIPHAKAIAITDFKQLIEIKKNGMTRVGKEWYVMSKDFGKLSYMEVPAVRSIKKAKVGGCFCSECKTPKSISYKGTSCTREGCEGHFEWADRDFYEVGFICPSCGHLLSTPARKGEDSMKYHLDAFDFIEKNKWNEKCWFCDEALWQPYVRNLGQKDTKKKRWHRVTHYANKANKAKKTVWLLTGTEDRYFSKIQTGMLNDLGNEGGCRKYAPALYIKKQLKGFFDFALFDEVHQYKGGATAQGNAMHALIKSSKYQLGLTGTIAGGVATHLFSLLFRLDPGRMKAKGFEFGNEVPFAEQYGTIETVYEGVEDFRSNKMSKGRQIQSPKVKPGISPKVFTDFLMDRAVFLDLSDMSKFLPPLKEKVVITDTEPEVLQEYNRVVDTLKDAAKDSGGGGLLGSMLQFSLSYSDKPYGVKPYVNPVTGDKVVEPLDLSHLVADGRLLNKERELVNLINSEISEGRNCVVFAEYTNSEETCVTERLKEIIETHCGLYGQVQIIKASTPEAIKREAWLHDKASDGIRVFITNPKILETGVDLCFSHKGVFYNYPTLMFYQMGYSLFTIWQASRRHYRLCQKEECRTYYLASNGTVQPAVIKLIAAKQVATSAIQGKFSAEGLSVMAEGVDTRLVLAKALADRDTAHQDELQNMFDVLASSDDDTASDYVPMSTYYEVVGEEEPVKEVPQVPFIPDLSFGFMDLTDNNEESTITGDDFGMFMFNLWDLEPVRSVPVCKIVEDNKPKEESLDGYSEKIKVKGSAETMSLFDLLLN